MINLIPENAKSRVRREYATRVAVVWAFLLSTSLAASAVLLLPTYVLLARQSHTLPQMSADEAAQQADYEAVTKELAHDMVLVNQLARSSESIEGSEIVAHVEKARGDGVTLSGFYISYEEEGIRIEVLGTAKTREALRHFQETLRRDAYFLDAQVPVSDLAKDVDLNFTMTLTLRTS